LSGNTLRGFIQHIRDPQQNQLFDVWDRILSPMAYEKLKEGWQGVFREVILDLLPVDVLAGEFDPDMGRPTKELYSMAGLLLIKEFRERYWPSKGRLFGGRSGRMNRMS